MSKLTIVSSILLSSNLNRMKWRHFTKVRYDNDSLDSLSPRKLFISNFSITYKPQVVTMYTETKTLILLQWLKFRQEHSQCYLNCSRQNLRSLEINVCVSLYVIGNLYQNSWLQNGHINGEIYRYRNFLFYSTPYKRRFSRCTWTSADNIGSKALSTYFVKIQRHFQQIYECIAYSFSRVTCMMEFTSTYENIGIAKFKTQII